MTYMTITYKLQRPLTAGQLKALAEFANTYGLLRFRVEDGENRLRFDFDASRLQAAMLESLLRREGIPVVGRLEES